MSRRTERDPKVVDFQSAKAVRDFVDTASQRIFELEDAHYAILDTQRLDIAKEIAAEALGEDLEIYLELEPEVAELNFDNDSVDGNMGLPWDEYDT